MNNTNTSTDSQLNLIATLATNTILPKQTHCIKVTQYSGRSVDCDSFHMESDDIIMNHDLTIHKLPINTVKSIRFINEVQYPELPAWYRIPPKSDPFGWTMTNIRAVLNNLQQHTQSDVTTCVTTLPLVLSTRFNTLVTDQCLILNMSVAWSGLPVYIRHFFLDELYCQYVVMNRLYGVPDTYNRIYMYSYDHSDTPVGIRTPYMTLVSDGPVVYY